MTTFNWRVEQMDCVPTEGDLTDVVQTVHWRCNASDDSAGQLFTATSYGTTSLPTPTPENPFTPYPDLTEEQVLGWCYTNGLNQTEIQENLQSQIAALINPPIVTPPLPWVG